MKIKLEGRAPLVSPHEFGRALREADDVVIDLSGLEFATPLEVTATAVIANRCRAVRIELPRDPAVQHRWRPLCFAVPGPVAATRQRAEEVREQLRKLIDRSEPGDTITIDLSEVEAMTVSFADELFGNLLADRASGTWLDRRIFVSRLSSEVRETAVAALERRRQTIRDGVPNGAGAADS